MYDTKSPEDFDQAFYSTHHKMPPKMKEKYTYISKADKWDTLFNTSNNN